MGIAEYMRFPSKEFERRCNRARELMERDNLAGLFITEGGNYTYFSGGGRDFSFSRPHILLLPRQGEPVAIVQEFPAINRTREIWFDDVRVYRTMTGLPVELVADLMEEKGIGEGRVGAELGFEQRMGISFRDFALLRERLRPAEFVDAADLLWEIRMIKSPEEIRRHREACRITVRAYEALFLALREGMSEQEIIERFHRLLVEMGGADPWSFICSGPENYNGNSGGPTARRIRRSDLVWIDGGCTYREYASDFCCTGTVGQPSSRQRKMQELVEEITRAVVRKVRPGIRARDLDAINSAEWEKRGYDYREINWGGGRIGHGLGWGSCLTEPPHIASYDQTVIRAGMVFTIEPGINTEYGSFQTEMDLAVTEEGCEILNEMDRGLRVIEG